jgi:CRISPR/Cas system CMR-associated protein Cmr5 small subunit
VKKEKNIMSDLISKMQKVANQLDSHNHFDEANYITSLMVKIAQANTGFGGAPAVKPLSFDEDFYQNLPTTETYNPSDPSKPLNTPDALQNLEYYRKNTQMLDKIVKDFQDKTGNLNSMIINLGKKEQLFEIMDLLIQTFEYFVSREQKNIHRNNFFPEDKKVLGTAEDLRNVLSKIENDTAREHLIKEFKNALNAVEMNTNFQLNKVSSIGKFTSGNKWSKFEELVKNGFIEAKAAISALSSPNSSQNKKK